MPRVLGRVDVEREQRAEPPHVSRRGCCRARTRVLGREALEVEHDLDRAAVERVEVHRRIGRVFGAGRESASGNVRMT